MFVPYSNFLLVMLMCGKASAKIKHLNVMSHSNVYPFPSKIYTDILPTDSVSLSELSDEYFGSCVVSAATWLLPTLLHVLVDELLATDNRVLASGGIPFS